MIVGEAPGANEDQQGLPFVGASGAEQDRMLGEAGLTPSEIYYTNYVKARPPDNKFELVESLGIPLEAYKNALIEEILSELHPLESACHILNTTANRPLQSLIVLVCAHSADLNEQIRDKNYDTQAAPGRGCGPTARLRDWPSRNKPEALRDGSYDGPSHRRGGFAQLALSHSSDAVASPVE